MVRVDVLKRLAQLNKGALKYTSADKPADPNMDRGGNPAVCEPALRIRGEQVKLITLEEAVPGIVTQDTGGEFLLIKRRFSDIITHSSKLIKPFRDISGTKNQLFINAFALNNTTGAGGVHPSKLLFLDIETCGLTNAPLFLIGTAYFTGEDFVVLQLFARSFCEERPLLSFFTKLITQYDMLISFNGRSFDVPFIISRGQQYRIDIPTALLHIDLLFKARELWGRTLPDCKLQTIERHILGRTRTGDIPGSKIPDVYSEFVQTGNAALIQRVLEHNTLDVITMIEIVGMILTYKQHNP